MARTKSIDKIYEDIEQDAIKISKNFNKQVAEEFKLLYNDEAYAWYTKNIPTTGDIEGGDYKRTYQLMDNALLIRKEEEYGEKISLSPDKIKPKKGKKPTKKKGEYGSYIDNSGTLPSYYSWNKNELQKNIASDVLEWEERGLHNFARYHYHRGEGIYGSTLKKMIQEIDKIKKSENLKVSLPDYIVEDLYNLLKQKTKKIMQKRYNELYK